MVVNISNFDRQEAIDPMTVIAIGTALVPMIQKYIGLFQESLKCSSVIKVNGISFGYTETYDANLNGWKIGYYNETSNTWASVTVDTYDKVRDARKIFRKSLHNG